MTGRAVRPALLTLVALLVAACSSGGGDAAQLVFYERVWPDGFTEETTIFEDGRVSMLHGGSLERFTLSNADLGRIRDALAEPIEPGSADDSPQRSLTLPDGTVVDAPRPVPDGAIDLLDRLTSTHTLEPGGPAVDPVRPSSTPGASAAAA